MGITCLDYPAAIRPMMVREKFHAQRLSVEPGKIDGTPCLLLATQFHPIPSWISSRVFFVMFDELFDAGKRSPSTRQSNRQCTLSIESVFLHKCTKCQWYPQKTSQTSSEQIITNQKQKAQALQDRLLGSSVQMAQPIHQNSASGKGDLFHKIHQNPLWNSETKKWIGLYHRKLLVTAAVKSPGSRLDTMKPDQWMERLMRFWPEDVTGLLQRRLDNALEISGWFAVNNFESMNRNTIPAWIQHLYLICTMIDS